MKLSFSTRGWAHLTWDEWLNAGVELGFEGVEVYNLPKFPELMERSGPFHKYNINPTKSCVGLERRSIGSPRRLPIHNPPFINAIASNIR